MSDSTDAPARPPLNGGRLVAALPVLPIEPGGTPDSRHGFYVVVELGAQTPGHRYVAAWVRTLQDPEWNLGNYSRTFGVALENAVSRAGWGVLRMEEDASDPDAV